MINLLAQATDYELLQSLPGITKPGSETVTTFTSYLPGIFNLVIGIAAVLAVVMIIYGGIQYMSTDAFQGKNDAKDTIWNAVLGLILAIAAWLILFTLYPDEEKNPFVNFNLAIDRLAVPGMQRPDLIALKLPASEQAALFTSEKAKIGCPDCVVVVPEGDPDRPAPFPSKDARSGGCDAGLTTFCYVHKDLHTKLTSLANELKDKIVWRVTELVPPDARHQSECHETGKCADASISVGPIGKEQKFSSGNFNGCTKADIINPFLRSVSKVFGGDFLYEVQNTTCRNYYIANTDRAFRDKITVTGKLEHVHISIK